MFCPTLTPVDRAKVPGSSYDETTDLGYTKRPIMTDKVGNGDYDIRPVDSLYSHDRIRHDLLNENEKHDNDKELVTQSPYVEGTIQGKGVRILIDSGSDISAINERVFEDLKHDEDKLPILPVNGLQIVTATGTKSQRIKFQTMIDIKFSNEVISVLCYVVPRLNSELIIGADWLEDNKGIINFRDNVFSFEKSNRLCKIKFSNEYCEHIQSLKIHVRDTSLDKAKSVNREGWINIIQSLTITRRTD